MPILGLTKLNSCQFLYFCKFWIFVIFFFCQIFFCQFWIWFSFIKKIGFLKLPQRWRMRWTSSWPRKICTVRWWPRSGFNSAGTTTMNRPIPAQHFLCYRVWFQGVLQGSVSNSATKKQQLYKVIFSIEICFYLGSNAVIEVNKIISQYSADPMECWITQNGFCKPKQVMQKLL